MSVRVPVISLLVLLLSISIYPAQAKNKKKQQLAKREAAAVLAGPNDEVSKEEIDHAINHMRSHWQKTYGLVEVG